MIIALFDSLGNGTAAQIIISIFVYSLTTVVPPDFNSSAGIQSNPTALFLFKLLFLVTDTYLTVMIDIEMFRFSTAVSSSSSRLD